MDGNSAKLLRNVKKDLLMTVFDQVFFMTVSFVNVSKIISADDTFFSALFSFTIVIIIVVVGYLWAKLDIK